MELKLKELLLEKINFNYPNYFYGYYTITVKNGILKIRCNNNSKNINIDGLLNFLNNLKEKYIILSVRSELEPNTLPFPSKNEIETLKTLSNKKILVFNQDPWPAPIPNFETEANSIVIKFGWDERCEIDKMIVTSNEFKVLSKDFETTILINNNKIIELDNY